MIAGRRATFAFVLALSTAAVSVFAAPIRIEGPSSAAVAARMSKTMFVGDFPVQLVETIPEETTVGHGDLPRARDVWIEMIDGARDSIDLEGFYLSAWPGEPLDDVITALGKAAARGVRVRLLLDKGMGATYPKPADSLAILPGFARRWIDFKRVAGGVQHAKYFVVEGRDTTGLAGGDLGTLGVRYRWASGEAVPVYMIP